jgi:hypothetical protein
MQRVAVAESRAEVESVEQSNQFTRGILLGPEA